MTRWQLLSYVPGTTPHRIYSDTCTYIEEARAFIDMAHRHGGDPFPKPPRLPRSPTACTMYIESMLATLAAMEAVERGLSLEECESILAEHMPSLT